MKSLLSLLSVACVAVLPLSAGGTSPTMPAKDVPAQKTTYSDNADQEKCDKSENCKVCKRKRDAIAMEGDRYDNALSNEANRAAENGNTQREQDLINREQNAEQRQDQREYNESARTQGRR